MIVRSHGFQLEAVDPVQLLSLLEELAHICYMGVDSLLQIILSFSDAVHS